MSRVLAAGVALQGLPVLGALLLSGCGTAAPASDVARYAEILGAPQGLEADLARCASLGDADLAGDCALVVVGAAGLVAEEGCPRVPEGVWQDECWFVEAEKRRVAGQDQSAAGLCLKAGVFRDDCGQHLWQTGVHDLIHRRGPEAFPTQLPRAQALHGRWARLLADQTDLSERFWDKYYGNGFEGQGGVDLSHCDGLPEEHRQRCRAAGVAFFGRDLGPKLDQAGMARAFCELEAPGAEDVGVAFPNRADPDLDAVVRERHVAICGTP